MIYLFQKDTTDDFNVTVIAAGSEKVIKAQLKETSINIIFTYDDQNDRIEVIDQYYSPLECSYFIYKLLGLFKPVSTISVSYANAR